MNHIDYTTFALKIQELGYNTHKLSIVYPIGDSRCWSALVNPNAENLLVTYFTNRTDLDHNSFDIMTSNDMERSMHTDVPVDDVFSFIDNLISGASFTHN